MPSISRSGSPSDDTGHVRSRRGRVLGWALATILLVVATTLGACGFLAQPPRPKPYELWLYHALNFAEDDEVVTLEAVWRRAAAAGYRHVMLADLKFARLDEMDAHYFANLERARHLAEELGLEIVPGVFQLGRSGSLLTRDPNLAEGLPVRGALFEARAGVAHVVSDPPVVLAARPARMDRGVSFGDGVVAVRDNPGVARAVFTLRVQPFRCYHVSVEVRTRGFTGTPLVQVFAGRQAIQYPRSIGVQPDQEWTTHDIAFNSLENSEVDVYLGVWHAARGSLEWRGWKIEEVGPLNVVRRADAPCTLQGAVEGQDVETVRDTLLGRSPWRGEFDAWHVPPLVRTRLPDGARFHMSWTQAAVVFKNQVMACPSTPGVFDRLADEARRITAAWGPGPRLVMIDEIRALNQDDACRQRGESPGRILAEATRRCVGLLDSSRVYVWSDMFDPTHNAVRDFYLVRGDLAGSWEGLPASVVIVNWNSEHAAKSLRFFAGRGHRQILAGYYDGAPEDMRPWLRAARGVKGVEGVMYTTWKGDYDDLESFARVCREDR